MEKIYGAVSDLTKYALATELIEKEDVIYTVNSLLGALGIDDYPGNKEEIIEGAGRLSRAGIEDGTLLEGILSEILEYASAKGMLDGSSVVMRDLFDTKIMGILTPRPSDVIKKFRGIYSEDPVKATDWYYDFSRNTDYIRRYRIARDRRWKAQTEYGELDITINLSKPEKDPKAIAAARNAAQSSYPKCQLCIENEGYFGRVNHPARENHRIIPITIQDNPWGFQYSPYVYYNEHCIVFNSRHIPMAIIVGGSILSHDHFQGGHYDFAMAKAPVERSFTVKGFEDVDSGIVKWPMSCIRLSAVDPDRIIALADHILDTWRGYTDEDAFIYAFTQDTPHNTITPIARKRADRYELDLVLRNNITTEENPLGVYHPHAELHHIKKENIGLIEVMGMAILPARLLGEMDALRNAILKGEDFRKDPALEKHADWAEEFMGRYDKIDESNIDDVIQKEIGDVFRRVLEDAGVYKRTPEGQKAFDRFVDSL